jgi:phosphate transport system substrate-binding protein
MISRQTLGQVLIGLLFLVGPRAASAQLLINGAGATFPYPLYSKWFDSYAALHPTIHFNYQSIGSGGGIKQLENRTVDFGASDAPMNDEQLKAAPDKILHFPTVLGAVVVTYNLPELTQPLKLTGPVVANIYLGKVTKWNDPAITELNPGVALPDSNIVICHRSDGSGTTYIFTDYLSKVSPDWNKEAGKGTAVKWPVGLGGKGNEGVTALIRQTAASIGYVELIYAANNKLPAAVLRNRDGQWMEANLKTVTGAAAATAANMPADFRVSITDASGSDSYPIASFTYLLVYQRQNDAAKGRAIVDFINWMLHEGQKYAPALTYAPLPDQVIGAEENQLKAVALPAS